MAHSWGLAHDLWELQPGRGQGGGPQVHLALPRGDFTHQSWLQSTWALSLEGRDMAWKGELESEREKGTGLTTDPKKGLPFAGFSPLLSTVGIMPPGGLAFWDCRVARVWKLTLAHEEEVWALAQEEGTGSTQLTRQQELGFRRGHFRLRYRWRVDKSRRTGGMGQ